MAKHTVTKEVAAQLFPAQRDFRHSKALYRCLAGGIGVGKSWIGALDMLLRSKPNCTYMVICPTYEMLKTSSLRMFADLGRQYGLIDNDSLKISPPPYAKLTNGAEVLFRSADDPDHLRGPNLSGIWMDEASLMEEDAFLIGVARLREGGIQGWLSTTLTPKGRKHWTYERFGKPGLPNTEVFYARTQDNPFLPEGFAERLREQYTTQFALQELEGMFLEIEGALFKTAWLKLVDDLPKDVVKWVRSWDLAATLKEEGKDPDWTAGVLMGKTSAGEFVISDVRLLRGTPRQVEILVKETAEWDGKGVTIWMECEPGSSGKTVCDHYARDVLTGYDFHWEHSTGKKAERARPLAAAAEHGLLNIRRGEYLKEVLDQFEVFPFGGAKAHDDVIDAASKAHYQLNEKAFDVWKVMDQLVAGAKGDPPPPKEPLPDNDTYGIEFQHPIQSWCLYQKIDAQAKKWLFDSESEDEVLYAASLVGLGDNYGGELTAERREQIKEVVDCRK
jgi:predicted phage terminase large subunit-like protein